MSIITEVEDHFKELVERFDKDNPAITPSAIWSKEDIEFLEKALVNSDRDIESNPASEFRKHFVEKLDAISYAAAVGAGATYFNIEVLYDDNDEEVGFDVYYNGD